MKLNFQIFITLFYLILASGSDAQEVPEIGVVMNSKEAQRVKAAGFDFLEPGVGDFLKLSESEEVFEEYLERFQNQGIPVFSLVYFLPGQMKSVGPEVAWDEILDYASKLFSRAQKAGVQYVVFGSGASRNIPEGFGYPAARIQFITLGRTLASIAANFNVVILLEPLNRNETNFINTFSEAGEIVESVNHPNFWLLADIYHMKMENEGIESLERFAHLVKHVHVAEKEGRAPPGTYGEDFSAYYAVLKAIGYKGGISIEANWKDFDSQSKQAIQTIKQQWEKGISKSEF